jgi:glycosyltransferase involved in cell wall biosynthesis
VKVLLVITRAELGGAQSHVKQLLKALGSRCQFTVALGEGGALEDWCRAQKVSVVRLQYLARTPNIARDFKALSELRAIIRQLRPDLVHLHSSKAGFLGRLAAHLENVPSLYTVHGWAFSEGAPPLRRLATIPLELVASRLGCGLVTVSEYDQQLAAKYGIRSAFSEVIPNGIADSPCHRSRPGALAVPNLVMVARFAAPKRQDLVLRALSQIRSDCVITFVGSGPLEESARAFVRRKDLTKRVHFLGDRDDVPELLAGAHALILLSDHEAQPMSIIEGMRAGLPILASAVGGIPELVHNEETGLVVSNRDAVAISTAMDRLIRDSALRERLGAAGRAQYERKHTDHHFASQTFDTYLRVCTQP